MAGPMFLPLFSFLSYNTLNRYIRYSHFALLGFPGGSPPSYSPPMPCELNLH